MAEIVPNLSVADGAAAVAFYIRAFGAEELFRIESPDGHVFAEMVIAGARFFVAHEAPRSGNVGPLGRGGTTVRIDLLVDDPDAVHARAVAAGATEVEPVQDHDGQGPRMGSVDDPFGHRWLIGRHWTGRA